MDREEASRVGRVSMLKRRKRKMIRLDLWPRQADYGLPEICRMLGMQPNAVYLLIKNEELKTSCAVRGKITVSRAELERWRQAQLDELARLLSMTGEREMPSELVNSIAANRPMLELLEYRLELNAWVEMGISEPDSVITSINGRIIRRGDGNEMEAGTLRVYLAPLVNDYDISPLDMLDALNQDVAEYLTLLDKRGEWLPAVEELFEPVLGSTLMILDRMEIKPEHRGKRLGLVAVKRLIDVYADQLSLVALKPFPLQFIGMKDPDWVVPPGVSDDPEAAFCEARAKLEAYWALLGFESFGSLMVLNPHLRGPSLEDLVEGKDLKRGTRRVTKKRKRAHHVHRR